MQNSVELPSLEFVPIDGYLSSSRHLPPSPERTQLEKQLQQATEARAQLLAIIADLTCKEAWIASYIEGLSRVLVPYRKLPSDLWTMIFDHVPESRWEISWVCRGWREVALSSSSLWTILPKIGYPTSSPTNFFESLRVQCARAGSRPLTISKLRLPPAFGFQHTDFIRFLMLFRDLVPRIGQINVSVDPLWEGKDLGLLTVVPQARAFTLLKNVAFTFSPPNNFVNGGSQPPAEGVVIFDSSPGLSEMSLFLPRRENWQSVVTWLRIPWTNFKFLELGWILPSDVYHILRNAPRLETLLASVCTAPRHDVPPSPYPAEPIGHHQLQSLALVSDQISEIDLSLFHLPKARQVFVDSDTLGTDGLPQLARTPFAAHSNAPIFSYHHLTHLFFGPTWKRDGPYLVELLKLTPSLVQLSVSWLDEMDALFAALSAIPDSESVGAGSYFLPSLVSLRTHDTPLAILSSATLAPWHTEIGRLAIRRGTQTKKPGAANVTPVTITLSGPRKQFGLGSAQTHGKGAVILLNQAIALLGGRHSPSQSPIETESAAIKSISQPLRVLREFLVEFANHSASGTTDDLVSFLFSVPRHIQVLSFTILLLMLDLLYLAARLGVSTERRDSGYLGERIG